MEKSLKKIEYITKTYLKNEYGSNCNIKYNKDYITAAQAFENVKAALIDYAQNIGYNGCFMKTLYYGRKRELKVYNDTMR